MALIKIPMEMEVDTLETLEKITSGTVSVNAAVARNTSNGWIDEHLKLVPKHECNSESSSSLVEVALGATVVGGTWAVYEVAKWLRNSLLNKKAKHLVRELCEFAEKLKTNAMVANDYDRLISLLATVKKNAKLRARVFVNEEAYDFVLMLASSAKNILNHDASDKLNASGEHQATILADAVQYLLAKKDQYYHVI